MRQPLRATRRAHDVVALAGDARMLLMSQETLMRSAGAELQAIVDCSGKAHAECDDQQYGLAHSMRPGLPLATAIMSAR
ncbi:hypothetical protein KC367_g274 [Hortaea werneckii]|nr:hypothetical protein KC367_g274 [Hortaea werneckii]